MDVRLLEVLCVVG